jgi:ferric-dicitrate binding protein FerR (iron transport regulator)
MNKKYTKYDASRLSTDLYFLSWRLLDDPGARMFWEGFLERYPGKRAEIEEAARVIDSVRFNHRSLTTEEVQVEVERLVHSVRRLRRWRLVRRSAVAASVMVALMTVALLLSRREPAGDLAGMVARVREQKVRLELAGSRVVELERDVVIAYGTNGRVTMLAEERDTAGEIPVDRVVVPNGRRAVLLLPDGSKVWLNAGSEIEFPARFTGSREVRASGEVYVEVARDTSRSFTLHAPRFSVKAMGTKFQVSAYAGEKEQSVVLVEGEVEVVAPGDAPVTMHPSERFVSGEAGARVERVDTLDYTSWKDGVLRFTNRPLEEVLSSLSRYYGVPIEYEGKEEARLSGKLILFDDLATVLENIAVIVPSHHEVRDDAVIVKSGRR